MQLQPEPKTRTTPRSSAPSTKSRQISVRLGHEADHWLEQRAGGGRNKAAFVRQLIEREMVREEEERQLAMFNAAAADLTSADRRERDALLGGFALDGPGEGGE